MTDETQSQLASRLAVEAIEREMASWNEPRPKPPRRRPRQNRNDSISYSIRLYPEEVEMIEARAEKLGVRPTGLARNLIRSGLASGGLDEVTDTLDRLEQVVAELRSLVG